MAAGTFDLADAISKLLVRLREFRKKLKAAQPIMRQLRLAIKRNSSALEELAVLSTSPLPEQKPARRKAEERRARLSSKVGKLQQALNDRLNQYQASTAFTGPFQNEVELVLQRLPLKPEWQPFPDVIRSLLLASLGSYQKMFHIQDLDTLEFRLKEMLDLAKTNTKTTSFSGDTTPSREESIREDGIGRAYRRPFTGERRRNRTALGDDTLDSQRSKAAALAPGVDLPAPPTAVEAVWAASTSAAPGSSLVPTPAQNPAPVEAATAKEPAQAGDPVRLATLPTSTAKSDQGNVAILRDTDGELRRAVTLDVAHRFGGVSRRAIDEAAHKGLLKTEGRHQQRRVLVESLLKYFPPEK
jgi:hypothetical protein